ncbi:MAG TPA: 4Fe-4S binding protein, partial [Candidatus Bathyarchaeia archaeon]|nr:4Fe-4S binding protein [Candidatus Bathyarchaeia archaeon]
MSKVDLSVDFCGLRLRNPLVLAAGAPGTFSGESILRAAKYGVAAIMTYAVGPEPCVIDRPTFAFVSGGLLNTTTFSDVSEDRWIKKEIPAAKKAGIPIFTGVDLRFGIDAMQKTARKLTEAGVDMLVVATMDPKDLPPLVKLVGEVTDLPIIGKIGPSPHMEMVGEPIERAGADAIMAINGPWGMRINVETGKPMLGSLRGVAHFCGAPIFPLAVFATYVLSSTVKIPILGGGGVTTGEDIVELLMAGATAVGSCTGVMIRGGPESAGLMIKELETTLDRRGTRSAREIIACTKDFLKGRTRNDLVTDIIPPDIDDDLCTACGACAKSCPW